MKLLKIKVIIFIILISKISYGQDNTFLVAISPLLTPSMNFELIINQYGFGIDLGTYLGGGSMINLKFKKFQKPFTSKKASYYYGLLIEKYSYEALWPKNEKGTYITPKVFGGFLKPIKRFIIGGEFGLGYPIIKSIEPDDPTYEYIQVPMHLLLFVGLYFN